MARHDREERRRQRAADEVEKGLGRGKLDHALEWLAALPPAERAPYLPRSRKLLGAAVARGPGTGLAQLARRVAAAGLFASPPGPDEPNALGAVWACLWALAEKAVERPLDPPEAQVAGSLFEALRPAMIERHPAAADAVDTCLRPGPGAGKEGLEARYRLALAEAGAWVPEMMLEEAWPRCAPQAGSASEGRAMALAAWASCGWDAFARAAGDVLRPVRRPAPDGLAGSAAGIGEAATLEILRRLGAGGDSGESAWAPLSLVEAALELGPPLDGAARDALCALFRAAVQRSGIVAGGETSGAEADVAAVRRLGLALLAADCEDRFAWVAAWLEGVRMPRWAAASLAPLYERALSRARSVSLWANAALAWDAAFCSDPPPAADGWIEAGALRFAPAELAGWLRRAAPAERGGVLEFIAGHLAAAERVLDGLWNADAGLHADLSRAYYDLVDRCRERRDSLRSLRGLAQCLAQQGVGPEGMVDLLDQIGAAPVTPLTPAGVGIFRRACEKAVRHEPRLMLVATEILDESRFVVLGRKLIESGAPIDACLFAVEVAETKAEFPLAGDSLFNETLVRFAADTGALAEGVRYALARGFPDEYLDRMDAALRRALELGPEARALPAVLAALERGQPRRRKGSQPRAPRAGKGTAR